MKLCLFISAFLLVGCFSAHSQNVKNDLQRLSQTFGSMKGISVNLSYSVFDSHSGTRAIQTEVGSFKADFLTGAYVYKLGNITHLHNTALDLLVSTDDKLMAVEYSQHKKTLPVLGVDTSGGDWAQSKLLSESGNERTWRIYFKKTNPEYAYMDVSINLNSFLASRISLYYKNKMAAYLNSEEQSDNYLPKLTIAYQNYVINPRFMPDDFSENKYLKSEAGQLIPLSQYKDFELIVK